MSGGDALAGRVRRLVGRLAQGDRQRPLDVQVKEPQNTLAHLDV